MIAAIGLRPASLASQTMLVTAIFSIAYATVVVALASPQSFYTLDDPYIHFALAENLARGHFGVNLGEVSNPSSSILWPWLMAAAERLGVMVWAPLILNIACFIATVRLLLGYVLRQLVDNGRDDGREPTNALIFTGLAVFSFNLFGVVFTGMEHSLHVLVCLAGVIGVIEKRYSSTTLAALVLAPLVRFEGALVLAFGLGAAIADRKYAFALLAAALVAIGFGAYEGMLSALSLPALPSSVLAKSRLSAGLVDGEPGLPGLREAGALTGNFVSQLRSGAAPIYAVFAAALSYAGMKSTGRERLAACGLLAVLILAFSIKTSEVYGRYDVWIFCVMFAGAIHLLRPQLIDFLKSRRTAILLGAGFVLANAASGLYVFLTTPLAAENIDRQQHQMHRFITECWHKPVAVNDLGWASFRNDEYVLDLFGLGSEAARKARASDGVQWMDDLARQKHVEAAMIYPRWFGGVPANWTHVGDLVLTKARITPAESIVSFYATTPEAVAPVQACLRWLGTDLPDGALVKIGSSSGAGAG